MLILKPGLFWPGFFFLLGLAGSPYLQAGQVFSRLTVQSSSEPVPVYDMINGWDNSFRPGSYAYADMRLESGVALGNWSLAHEQRDYYYLGFAPDTAEFYYNLEQGIDGGRRYRLALDVQTLTLQGLRLSHRWEVGNFTVQPVVSYYQVQDYQLGSLRGFSDGSGSLSVSAELDYHFNEDKLLEYPADVGQGRGVSTDLNIAYESASWHLSLGLQDLWNRFDLQQAAFTRGCINLAGAAGAVCESSGAASGVSGHEDYLTSIPVTVQAQALYEPLNLAMDVYRHEQYQRLSVQKNWNSPLGELGISAHSTRQLGLHWSSRWHELSLVSDHADWQQAHDLQLLLGVRVGW